MPAQFTLADLRQILINRIGIDEEDIPDDPDATFDSIGLDSLAVMELQLEVEQRYGFRISEEDAEKIRSLRESVDYVNSKLAELG
jgi:acyl carrier protein